MIEQRTCRKIAIGPPDATTTCKYFKRNERSRENYIDMDEIEITPSAFSDSGSVNSNYEPSRSTLNRIRTSTRSKNRKCRWIHLL